VTVIFEAKLPSFVPLVEPPVDLFEIEMEVFPGDIAVLIQPGLCIGSEVFNPVEVIPAVGLTLALCDSP